MFIGHVIGAELARDLSPQTPLWVSLGGVSFPDLLWGVAVLAGIEQVQMDPVSPLQKDIRFISYPYSHSLVLGSAIACLPGAAIAAALGWVAGVVFVLSSISHWLLDVIVHLPDLPVLGFGRDVKVGLGLWRYGPVAFVVEYALVAAFTVALTPRENWQGVLVTALTLHAFNANSFFGFTRGNPLRSGKVYAVVALVGFAALIWSFNGALTLSQR
jgi:hypothetical protein